MDEQSQAALDQAPMDQQAAPIEPAYRHTPPSGVNVVLEPPLEIGGYRRAPGPVVGAMYMDRTMARRRYWTQGEGAKRFLTEVAAALNASPHLAAQPFELVFTREMSMEIDARLDQYATLDDEPLSRVLMTHADAVATALLSNLVRKRRWSTYEVPGRLPRPFTLPMYSSGAKPRGGAFDPFLVGQTAPTLNRGAYEAWLLENNMN